MLPAIVISDPELTVGLPPKLTAWTGMDALAHCLEAYCAPGFHPMADGIAIEGMRLIKDVSAARRRGRRATSRRGRTCWRRPPWARRRSRRAWARCTLFATRSARCYDTHHGLTNGVLMPYVLAFNRPAIEAE